MVSATSSRQHSAHTPARLGLALAAATEPVWILGVRTDAFARVAWERGREVALVLERRVTERLAVLAREILHAGDAFVHEAGTDLFAFALTGGGPADAPAASDRRGTLAAIERAVRDRAGVDVYAGWIMASPGDDPREVLAAAADRGKIAVERRAFAAMLHDLTTPISAIYGSLVAATDGVVPPEVARRFLDSARNEALRTGRLIRGFLSAHADEKRACDAFESLEQSVAALQPVALARDVDVRMCERSTHAAINLGVDRAMGIIVSLVENAVKHGKRGGHVVARVVTEDDFARIEVDDDGPGVEADNRDRIFQFGTRSGGAEGFGIGLAHARLLVGQCGGSISVEASPLGGARFVLRLPLIATER